jgi:hypothetical protein
MPLPTIHSSHFPFSLLLVLHSDFLEDHLDLTMMKMICIQGEEDGSFNESRMMI